MLYQAGAPGAWTELSRKAEIPLFHPLVQEITRTPDPRLSVEKGSPVGKLATYWLV